MLLWPTDSVTSWVLHQHTYPLKDLQSVDSFLSHHSPPPQPSRRLGHYFLVFVRCCSTVTQQHDTAGSIAENRSWPRFLPAPFRIAEFLPISRQSLPFFCPFPLLISLRIHLNTLRACLFRVRVPRLWLHALTHFTYTVLYTICCCCCCIAHITDSAAHSTILTDHSPLPVSNSRFHLDPRS